MAGISKFGIPVTSAFKSASSGTMSPVSSSLTSATVKIGPVRAGILISTSSLALVLVGLVSGGGLYPAGVEKNFLSKSASSQTESKL